MLCNLNEDFWVAKTINKFNTMLCMKVYAQDVKLCISYFSVEVYVLTSAFDLLRICWS